MVQSASKFKAGRPWGTLDILKDACCTVLSDGTSVVEVRGLATALGVSVKELATLIGADSFIEFTDMERRPSRGVDASRVCSFLVGLALREDHPLGELARSMIEPLLKRGAEELQRRHGATVH